MGLERFLHRLVAQPKLASDKLVLEFLTVESGWDEKVEATDYVKKSGKKSNHDYGFWGLVTSQAGCVYWFSQKATWLKQVSAKFKTNNKKITEMKYYIEGKRIYSHTPRVNVIMMIWSFLSHCAQSNCVNPYSKELSEHLKATLKTRQRIKERVFRSKQLASNYAK